ncbi:uncharacterized protein LOC120633797 [Pararge aegeria]|uniref:uncharacterized protein LOC120633797 n=1 Tax=Pararge aegeria TaxID=116150 RepID=UPI0019CFE550|nr:uncharacterized protein LOC120633797 [Pararge aegeria]
MKTFLLTIPYLLYLVNAKLLSKIAVEKNVAEDFDRKISSSKEDGRYSNIAYLCTKNIRNPRLSNENTVKPINVTKLETQIKPKVTLLKKPIPKFTYTGSEEDYLAKTRFMNRFPDSIEHEDEDFSVDDYDFDVNHDEFAGRGKPLESRVRVKVVRQRLKGNPPKIEKSRPTPVLSQIKVLPHNEGKPSIKLTRKAVADKMKEEEYDDEFATGAKSVEINKISITTGNLVSDENEDSKDDKFKQTLRTARLSPLSFDTYADKLGEKSPGFMFKALSYLPLFSLSYSSLEKLNEDVIANN